MAHIVNCMLEADQDPVSHSQSATMPGSPVSRSETPSEKPDKAYVWRMYQPERKYQLFPRKEQPQAAPGKGLDPEQAFALAMNQTSSNEKSDKSPPGSGLRLRIKEHNLNRRRKVSVPELGPMTTVQEVPMDSPTIPGRPPLHERSISAPGHNWKHHHLAEVMIPTPSLVEEVTELGSSSESGSPANNPKSRSPLSPKSLAPLVIPTQGVPVPRLNRQRSLNRSRAGSTPIESSTAPRSARTDESPVMRTPYTPLSSSLTTPRSASTVHTNSTLPTPVTAPIECRASPKPWESSTTMTPLTELKETTSFLDMSATPKGASSTTSSTPVAFASETRPPVYHNANGHKRNQSESSGSIMERGRPRKRCDIVPGGIVVGRSISKRSRSADRRAFENLPQGWKSVEAPNTLPHSEAVALQKQALQQAARFEVLRKEDVEALSRELRQLDERTEYLRRTYNSLRAGRRNLHARICQYLRSPRFAKFSHDSMLKQEEALAELDNSIDDWVGKLEQAENRRTRVRQKLLEHVAAAATMPLSPGSVHGVSESLQMAIGIRSPHCLANNGAGNISTPPRSPTRQQIYITSAQQSPSPKRFVPSTIMEQPLGEETATAEEVEAHRRAVESIRVYAGDDVYALLADVENEFTKMSTNDGAPAEKQETPDENLSEDELRNVHRARSHEMLNSLSKKSSDNSISSIKTSSPVRPSAATLKSRRSSIAPKLTPLPAAEGEIFLTSAVFKP
ncbi:hypothetical protein PspLS_02559 [Pyricularia sp. CBS 133598]|nr:hypothetical protein PspLS_02559 [Pyricularia sp. CBS 133598]